MAGKNDCGMAGKGWREHMTGRSWRETGGGKILREKGCAKLFFFQCLRWAMVA